MFYLEIIESSQRIDCGASRGYRTPEEAARAARKFVDAALPQRVVRIYQEVGKAYLRSDGEVSVQLDTLIE